MTIMFWIAVVYVGDKFLEFIDHDYPTDSDF